MKYWSKVSNFVLRHSKMLVINLSLLLIGLIFILLPAPADRILNIQNYLITVGGIIAAFIIAYLSAKIYNIKSERERRQIRIDKLSTRLTAFRKILYFVMKSPDFWNFNDLINEFKRTYPEVTYQDLHSQEENAYLVRQNISEVNSHFLGSSIDLYTAMGEIYGTIHDERGIPFAEQRNVLIKYTLEDLERYHYPSNTIWYLLDGRYAKHGVGRFNDIGLSNLYTQSFNDLLPIASLKLKGKDFHRKTLADLGADFHENVIPEMAELIISNTGFPKSLIKTFRNLILIMIFGVFLPLIIQSINISDSLNVNITLLLVLITTLVLINFLFDIYFLIDEEIHTNRNI